MHFRAQTPSFSKVGGIPAEGVGTGHTLEDVSSEFPVAKKLKVIVDLWCLT